jgi:hypothetical protein
MNIAIPGGVAISGSKFSRFFLLPQLQNLYYLKTWEKLNAFYKSCFVITDSNQRKERFNRDEFRHAAIPSALPDS